MASLNDFRGLWSVGAVPSWLVPSPGVLRTGECGQECESPGEEVGVGWALDWLVCIERHTPSHV